MKTTLTTRQLARRLRTTPRHVRRVLRIIRNDHRYTRYQVEVSRRELNQKLFERAHSEGKRHARYWLDCNEAAVDTMRQLGFDPAVLEYKTLVSCVVLKVNSTDSKL